MKYNYNRRDKDYQKSRYLAGEKEYLETDLTLRQVCAKNNLDRFTFSNLLKSKGFSIRKKITANESLFEKIDTEEKAYWLGFLYADGSVTYINKPGIKCRYNVELALAMIDKGHLEKYKLFLNTKQELIFREKVLAYRLLISSKKICENLITLGCIPKKSLVLTFPNNTQVSDHLIRHFIRGYFDGDGSISIIKSLKVSLLGTKEFLEEILLYLNLNISIIKKDKRHENNTYYFQFRVKEALLFLDLIYKDSTIYLDRKYQKYIEIINRKDGRRKKSK